MLSRRRFMGCGLAGMLTAATGCRPSDFDQLTQEKTSYSNGSNILDAKSNLAFRKDYFLGYPLNMNVPPDEFFAWRSELKKVGIGDFGYNNVGNPYMHSSIPFNTHELERETINRFGKLYGFEPRDTWGFLSHSGTDSNMHGMYIGRTILKAQSGKVPKCYFTKEAHYSIQILSDLLGMEAVFVNTLPDGGMDPSDLLKRLRQEDNVSSSVLVVATIGTTFKGAIDNVSQIRKAIVECDSYLHLDAALFGGYLPHTIGANEVKHKMKGEEGANRYDSIAISCHKFFGFPSPAGLFITTQGVYDYFNDIYSTIHNPEYIGHVPGTITCSRDAVKPAEFYYFSSKEALEKQASDAHTLLRNTDYLLDQIQIHFPGWNPIRSNNLSNTIYFRRPGKDIIKKYSLATMHVELDGETQDFAHVVIMPHVSRRVLDEFLDDLASDKSIRLG